MSHRSVKKADVDPRIEITTVADGEVHILFHWTEKDLAQMALAFMAVSSGEMCADDVVMALRMRDKIGLDYVISKLQAARESLFGKDKDGEE